MHIKKGDNVIVLSGANKGKHGKVLRAFPATMQVIVEGVNVHKKHDRARRTDQKGQIVDKTMPIHASNVARAETVEKKPTQTRTTKRKAVTAK